MDSPLLFAALLGFGLAISYYSWRKEGDRIELYYTWMSGAGICAIVWQQVASTVLHVSGGIQSINHYFLFVFWLAEAVAWLFFTVKHYMRKRR